jgi:hypothetical protein
MTVDQNSPWMTVFACLLAVLFTLVGGIVALVHTQTLPFADYLDRTGKAAVAIAALGVGRSLKKGLAGGAGVAVPGGWINRAPVATFTVGAMVLIAGVTGGVLTIADPSLLSFDAYLDQMTTFAFAVGLQGAGRAVKQGIAVRGQAAGGGAGAANPLADHPDFAAAAAAAAVPALAPAGGLAPELDPADVASEDDDMGADAEPTDAEDLDETGLPTDEEEAAHPPPPDPDDLLPADAYALDEEAGA